MAIVVKRSVSGGEEKKLITGSQIDWTTMEFGYKNTARVDFTSSATAYEHNFISGWDYTFDAVEDGLYEVDAMTDYLCMYANYELDFRLNLVSGGTEMAHWHSVQTESQLAQARHAKLLIKATGTSISVNCFVTVGAPSMAIKLYAGLITSRRVA